MVGLERHARAGRSHRQSFRADPRVGSGFFLPGGDIFPKVRTDSTEYAKSYRLKAPEE